MTEIVLAEGRRLCGPPAFGQIYCFSMKSSLLFLDQQDSVFSVQMGFSSP